METVIDALRAMRKATYREVAARLEIEPVEALNMLREQREQGLCDFTDGGWYLTPDDDATPEMATTQDKPVFRAKNAVKPVAKPLRGEEPKPVKPETIVALLAENGDMDTVALASAVGRDPRGLASNLCLMARRGQIQKIGQGKGVKWGLPGGTKNTPAPAFVELPEIEITAKAEIPAEPVTPAPTEEPERVTAATETFLESIPILRTKTQSIQIPTLREINTQIRKTKSNLSSLEKLRDAVRVVVKHKRALRLFDEDRDA